MHEEHATFQGQLSIPQDISSIPRLRNWFEDTGHCHLFPHE